MTTTTFGIPCASCRDFLSAPIMTLDKCHHNLHKKCFEKISQQEPTCPSCSVKFTKGTENQELEQLIVKLNHLAQILIQPHSSEPFHDKLLHTAIQEGEIEVVGRLIEQGVSVSTLVEGITPLYRACENERLDIARLLLSHGADPTQKNDLSYRAKSDKYWHLNDSKGQHDAVPMKAAVAKGNIGLVDVLISFGAPFDEPGVDGRTPLFTAVHAHQEKLALSLIEKGASLKIKDNYGIPLINMAVRTDSLQVVKELVQRGVSLNEKDEDESTALYDAASKDNLKLLSFLLENEAKDVINTKWLQKWTPLSGAVSAGLVENVKLLVDAGADLSITYEGLNIVELAKKELRGSTSFYESHPQYKEEGERIISKKKAVVDYLQEVFEKQKDDFLLEETKPLSPSDCKEILNPLNKMTLFQIQQAMKAAGAGAPFLLYDLRDKANNDPSWTPAPNPLCNTIDLMKTHQLIDGVGTMLPYVREAVKECIVGEGLNVTIKIPDSWVS